MTKAQKRAAIKCLTKARQLLATKNGWTKGTMQKEVELYDDEGYYRGTQTNASFCAVGAVRNACLGLKNANDEVWVGSAAPSTHHTYIRTLTTLAEVAVPRLQKAGMGYQAHHAEDDPEEVVISYNDSIATQKRSILSLFDRAIAKLEAEVA